MIKIRLWHYKLIPVLPNKMLISQWRECIAIKRQWEKGTLKHRLVSYVMNYDKTLFVKYVANVCDEMNKRKIKWKVDYYIEIINFCKREDNTLPKYEKISYYPEHNDRYLRQCYYNLQEKFDKGIITENEWKKLSTLFEEKEYK